MTALNMWHVISGIHRPIVSTYLSLKGWTLCVNSMTVGLVCVRFTFIPYIRFWCLIQHMSTNYDPCYSLSSHLWRTELYNQENHDRWCGDQQKPSRIVLTPHTDLFAANKWSFPSHKSGVTDRTAAQTWGGEINTGVTDRTAAQTWGGEINTWSWLAYRQAKAPSMSASWIHLAWSSLTTKVLTSLEDSQNFTNAKYESSTFEKKPILPTCGCPATVHSTTSSFLINRPDFETAANATRESSTYRPR